VSFSKDYYECYMKKRKEKKKKKRKKWFHSEFDKTGYQKKMN
jgi:hypothetical protein